MQGCGTVRLCLAADRAGDQQHTEVIPTGAACEELSPGRAGRAQSITPTRGSTSRGQLLLRAPACTAPRWSCTDVALPGEGQGPSWPSRDSQRAREAGEGHSACSDKGGQAVLGTAAGLTEWPLSTHGAHKGACAHHAVINRENGNLRFEGGLRAIVFLSRTERCLP